MTKVIFLALIFFLFIFGQARAELAKHLVISEVQVSGETATDEYIKLYNPTEEEISLLGYRLTKISLSGSKYNLVTTFPDLKIPPKSFFIVAHRDFKGEKNFTYTSTTYSLADDNALVLFSDAGKREVDKVGYGKNSFGETNPAIAPAKSDPIKRKIDGEDSNDNFKDFILKSSQNEPLEEEEEDDESRPDLKGILINELMPNPKSPKKDVDDEWIEIFNTTEIRIDLSGSIIRDGVGRIKEYPIPLGTFIEPGGYLIFYSKNTRISLGNSGDFVEFLDSSRKLIDKSPNYGTAKDDLSFSLFEEGWDFTKEVTSLGENIFESDEEEKVGASQKELKQKAEKPKKETKPKAKKASKKDTKSVKGAKVAKKDNEIAGVNGKIGSDREVFDWNNKTIGKILIFLGLLIGINYLVFREKLYEIYKQKFFGNS